VERADRFAEFVDLLDRILRQPATTSTGRYYGADGARSAPGCVQQPRAPFAVAATGPRGMRIAARYGATWVSTGDPSAGDALEPRDGAAVIRRQIALLEEACDAAGRDPASIARLVLTGAGLDACLDSPAAFEEARGAYADAGVTDLVVHWPRPEEPYAGDPSVLERILT
jgi:alkanesulfonate monooxygenase SsuD/methylene tetrahydromethanopterin reductase-like flavin-dependent oxidoreductase (luciferase family)